MAVAEIIGAAIGVLLLIFVAYLLVGSTLATAETVVTAQKDLIIQNEARLGTGITITEKNIDGNFSISNTGTEIISDFPHMDIYTYSLGSTGFQNYTYSGWNSGSSIANTWTITRIDNDYLHPKESDPGETMHVTATFSGPAPVWIEFCTDNGVYASAYL